MALSAPVRNRIKTLKETYDSLRREKGALLRMIDDAELPEGVYNSNAIENSTLTLRETEKILLEMEVSREVSLREVYEAKNLARVMQYIQSKTQEELSRETILLLHQMLIGNIDDDIAGRFRTKDEYVRIGTYIAPPPEHIDHAIEKILISYTSDQENYFVDKIAKFHLDFELLHPFNDGNGRIGRILMNYQLHKIEYPVIMIRDKEKQEYYHAFVLYRDTKDVKPMVRVLARALMESLHKRIAYLRGDTIVTLTEHAKQQGKPTPVILNAARRQTIDAFREKGIWKIGIRA